MEAPQGYHSVVCKNCQKAKLQYRCLSWNPNNDPRFVPWDCEGCLARIKEMQLDVGGRPVDMCEVCAAGKDGPDIPPIAPVYDVSPAESTSDISCTGCRELGAECEGLHIGSTMCLTCSKRGINCDWRELNNTCGFCRTQHLRCVRIGDSCTNRDRFVQAMRSSKQLREEFQPGPVKSPSDIKEAIAKLAARDGSQPRFTPNRTTDKTRSDWSNCRQHGVVCNAGVDDSRCGRCEEQDIKCDSRKPCSYCKTRRLRCSGQGDKCANCLRFGVDCRPHEEQTQDIPMDVDNSRQTSRDTLVKDPLGVNKSITKPPPGLALSTARQLLETGVERTGCRSCQKLGITCSGLHTIASKCDNCLEKDFDCDCTVKRRTCLYCRRRRLRCLGNQDSCSNCLRFGQECTQCSPPDRRSFLEPDLDEIQKKRQHMEENRQNNDKKRQYAPAQSPSDIIDGMRSATSWKPCLSCAEDPLLMCDRDSSGCEHCKVKNRHCQYPPLELERPESTNTRYCTTCYRPKSRLTPGPLCHRCMKAAEAKATTTPEPCHACRIMNTKCDNDAETCLPCQNLNFKCLRGPSFSQRGRYSTLCEPRSLPSAPANPVSNWNRYSSPVPQISLKEPSQYWYRNTRPTVSNNEDASAIRSKWSDGPVRCNERPTSNPAEKAPKEPATPKPYPSPLVRYLPKCDHVEGTDSLCLCGRGQPEPALESAADFMTPTPPPPPPLPRLIHVKPQGKPSQCKIGNDYCSDEAPCYYCRNQSTDSAEPRTRKKPRQTLSCDSCRSLMAKCDGEMPACTICKEKGSTSVYSIGPTVPFLSLKKAKQPRKEDCTIAEEQPETRSAEQAPEPPVVALPAEVERAVAKALEDLDMEEDWCVVTSDDVTAVAEEEAAEKPKSWGYKFW